MTLANVEKKRKKNSKGAVSHWLIPLYLILSCICENICECGATVIHGFLAGVNAQALTGRLNYYVFVCFLLIEWRHTSHRWRNVYRKLCSAFSGTCPEPFSILQRAPIHTHIISMEGSAKLQWE